MKLVGRILLVILVAAAVSTGMFFLVRAKLPQTKLTDPLSNNSPSVNDPIAVFNQMAKPAAFKPESLTLEAIFAENHNWIQKLPPEKLTTLLVTGDIILARSVNHQAATYQDFTWPFAQTGPVLKRADLTLISLESPLVDGCPLTTEGMQFCGDPRHLEGLIKAGIDVVNLANNHSTNYGIEGLNSTIKLLSDTGIKAVGTGQPTYVDTRGLRFGFLAYNDVGASPPGTGVDAATLPADINAVRQQADIVVVAFHWGVEYTHQPTERQQQLAHWAIDAGADLVVGNHPHWIQPVEIYKNRVIVYAHGNFIFDQMWSELTRQGVVGSYTFYEDQLIDVEFLPIQIINYGQPHFLSGRDKTDLLNLMKTESRRLASEEGG